MLHIIGIGKKRSAAKSTSGWLGKKWIVFGSSQPRMEYDGIFKCVGSRKGSETTWQIDGAGFGNTEVYALKQ